MTQQIVSPDVVRRLKASFLSRKDSIEGFIQMLVETESPSGDAAGSRAVVQLLADTASKLKCVKSVDRIDVPEFGQHIVIKAFQDAGADQILLVGHTDTVHSRGSINERPFRREDDKLFGPGVFDMKANCALAIETLRAFEDLDLKPRNAVTLVFTCDEEVGSVSGWPLLEQTAREATTRCGLVLEPSASGGRVKTGRKGTGMFTIKVEGKAAHAGLEPEKGASAILELARQTERLHSINNSGSGITLNVGIVKGGTRSNVVAAYAEGEIDVRFSTEAESAEIQKLLSSIESIDSRTRVYVSGGINRPPLERTAGVIELYGTAKAIASALDFELGEAQVGGASDGNFLAAMGIPVLDGLGISGDGAHAPHEHILVDDISTRAAIVGGLLLSV
jgi:glutamate carboxypeptidase